MIHMQQSLINDDDLCVLSKVNFLIGSTESLLHAIDEPVSSPFDSNVIDFLNAFSKNIRDNKSAKMYPDVITFGFWIRKASIMAMADKCNIKDNNIRVGRGISFHIAPSNVPVNYAYSLVSGLITGNICVVRIPSKDFPQVDIINEALAVTLQMEEYKAFSNRVFLVRYDRSKSINDVFSKISDVRIVWGGNNTIEEIRKSSLPPRGTEITFADRYSLAVIDSDKFLQLDEKEQNKLVDGFYNDTYLSDQNACTSPRIVAWAGSNKHGAKELFWGKLHEVVVSKYTFQPIMGVNKLTNAYILAAKCTDEKKYNPVIVAMDDNYIVRIQVASVDDKLMDYKDNSGYFFEYDCDDLMDLRDLCNNTHCQTIAYLGDVESILPLLQSGIKGVDRVVKIGQTMDFDLMWDGYNLYERLTRIVALNV